MTWLILALAALWLAYLAEESRRLAQDRRRLTHIVHVNGTRGKSTVCRLIEAGLRAGGVRVFCKTTGTDPMTIDTEGREEPVLRRGPANIKEQTEILHRAAEQGAQVLVVECMAVQPELQRVAQRDILRADVGVITNVRRDHTDVMGETLPQICDALCSTIPRGGILFTAEEGQAGRMEARARELDCQFRQVRPAGDEPSWDFGENIALALAVCQSLGVPRETALEGMARFHRDPYALSVHRLGAGIFVNGLSINDPQSTCAVWAGLRESYGWEGWELTLLVNNRPDRGSRTQDMVEVCRTLTPDQVWLMGASQGYMRRALRRSLPDCPVLGMSDPGALPTLREHQVVFAVGNLAGQGRELLARVREEGTPLV